MKSLILAHSNNCFWNLNLFQVAIHREGHAELSESVEELEKRNLEIMSEMFDCKVDDLKFTRSVFCYSPWKIT